MSTEQLENTPRRGRENVIGTTIVPNTDGRAVIFHTELDTEADPIPSDLEAEMLENASSPAIRGVLATVFARIRGNSNGHSKNGNGSHKSDEEG